MARCIEYPLTEVVEKRLSVPARQAAATVTFVSTAIPHLTKQKPFQFKRKNKSVPHRQNGLTLRACVQVSLNPAVWRIGADSFVRQGARRKWCGINRENISVRQWQTGLTLRA
jgi:hypothetical protein